MIASCLKQRERMEIAALSFGHESTPGDAIIMAPDFPANPTAIPAFPASVMPKSIRGPVVDARHSYRRYSAPAKQRNSDACAPRGALANVVPDRPAISMRKHGFGLLH
jgi:hypothetical protein